MTTGGVLLLGACCGLAFGGKTTFTIQKPEERWQSRRDTARSSGRRAVPDTMVLPGGGLLVNAPGLRDSGFSLRPGISDPRAHWLINQAHADTRTNETCRRCRTWPHYWFCSPNPVSIINKEHWQEWHDEWRLAFKCTEFRSMLAFVTLSVII